MNAHYVFVQGPKDHYQTYTCTRNRKLKGSLSLFTKRLIYTIATEVKSVNIACLFEI